MPNRQMVIMCPAESIAACRADVLASVPSIAGIEREVGPNSTSSIVTHYLGAGPVPESDIENLGAIAATHLATIAYLDPGSEGSEYYPSGTLFLAAFNLVFIENSVPPT